MTVFVPRNPEPDADPFQQIQELIVTYLKMKEKIYLSTPTYPKAHKNELSVSFRVLSSKFLGAEPETDIPTYVIFVTGNTEYMRLFINHLRRW